SILSGDDDRFGDAFLDEHRLVAEALGVERGDLAPRAAAAVATRQDADAQAARHEELSHRDDARRLPRPSRRDIADRDHRFREPLRLDNAPPVERAAGAVDELVKLLEKADHESSSTMRRAVRSDAPRFAATVFRARSPHAARRASSEVIRSAK